VCCSSVQVLSLPQLSHGWFDLPVPRTHFADINLPGVSVFYAGTTLNIALIGKEKGVYSLDLNTTANCDWKFNKLFALAEMDNQLLDYGYSCEVSLAKRFSLHAFSCGTKLACVVDNMERWDFVSGKERLQHVLWMNGKEHKVPEDLTLGLKNTSILIEDKTFK
jgi:hypothetical protein